MTFAEHEEERDRPRDEDPHHALNNPIDDPDETEWPDPYEKRPDPRGQPGPGGPSTSEPHPSEDIEAEPVEAPERDKLDQ